MSIEFLLEKFDSSSFRSGTFFDLYVYFDGRFLKGSDARIPVWDHALLYGDGVFEGIRAFDGKIFKLVEHIDRLYNSAKCISLENIPLTKDELKEAVIRTVRINNLRDAHIRPIITRGAGVPGIDPRRATRPSILVLAYPFAPTHGERPSRMITSTVRRKSPYSIDSRIKSLNYLDNILAKIQANAAGMDDAIMLDLSGFVAEGTGTNVFVVQEEEIFVPTTSASLQGITRATVTELCAKLGYRVSEQNLTIGDIYTASEAFLTGTGAGIHPIAEVDGRKIGLTVPGRITKQLMIEYERFVREEHLTQVY